MWSNVPIFRSLLFVGGLFVLGIISGKLGAQVKTVVVRVERSMKASHLFRRE